MARMARIVIPGCPHHVIQRGNRRQNVFFTDKDRQYYLDLLHRYAQESGLSFWAYCLMDNHVHLIAVPKEEGSLASGIGEVHRKYTRMVNFREGWRGYLWQGRFSSYPLGENYLYAAIRYVELNPVRAGIVKSAQDYPWSSAKAHILKEKDPLLSDSFVIEEIQDWSAYLNSDSENTHSNLFRQHSRSGRPLGSDAFITRLEKITGMILRKKKPGPKKNN